MATVTLENVVKRFGDVLVVKGISLEIRDKEFVVFVGPSGCGKSTSLRMIAGLEDISEGTIRIGDRVVNDVNPSERDIAMVFQSYALYPHMSVFENMAFGLRLRKVPSEEIDEAVNNAAAILGLADLLKRKPAQLSGGQRQRVAVGRAIVRNPKVFLFDEPLSNLDAKLRVQMRRELSSLQRRLGVTTIYVTHDQTEAMTMGDRIAVLSEGTLRQFGTPDEVYSRPADRFTAEFIGSPPMNIVDGKLTRNNTNGLLFGCPGFFLPVGGDLPEGPCALGFRPEDVDFVAVEDAAIKATCDFVEHLGGEEICYVNVGESEFRVRCEAGKAPKRGDRVGLLPKQDAMHFFDAQGQRMHREAR